MMTLLSISLYILLIAAVIRMFRSNKRADEISERLFRQYASEEGE